MKKGLLLISVMITMFYYAHDAKAAFFFEPYAGVDLGAKIELDDDKGDISGHTVGARVGVQNFGFMLGLDGRRASWKIKTDNVDKDTYFTTVGLFAGYDFPILLRIWGEYVFSHIGEDDQKIQTKYQKGSGTILGIGYKFFPFLSANIEYISLETSEREISGVESDFDSKYSSYLLSISIPLSI